MSDALIGKQLNNFRIERLLGRGGMAQVYYGIDVGLDRPVAIKVIDERWREEESFTTRFISEARTIATWRHDNIVQVYYAGIEDDLYYFVMEYVDGGDLTDRMTIHHSNDQLMPYDEAISILRTVASGLDYAHSKGVIHRDVKPSNIMIGNDERVVLMDFGMALDVDKGTIGESFGTPHYIAPEQARDAATAVAQSDQYALGVIAFEMLTGKVPFDNPSAMTVAIMHMTEEPPQPTSLNPSLTPDVENVLLKVLSKEPTDRFPSCQAFVETLENAIAGRPTLIDDVTPAQMGQILITPPTKSETQTLIGNETSSRIHLDQITQPAEKSQIPLTLIAVVIIAIVIIGGIFALSGNTSTEVTPQSTINAQGIDVATKTSNPTNVSTTVSQPPTIAPQMSNTRNPSAPNDAPTQTPLLPSATDLPTETPLPPTATDQPTDTTIPPTATHLPTETPLPPTATDQPTNTLIPPTATARPMNTTVPPTEEPIILLPTLAYPNGSPIVLFYNDSSLYVWNPSSERVRAGRFKFQAMDSNGNSLSRTFNGVRWTQFYSFINGGGCVAIEMTVGNHLKPSECREYNSVVNAQPSSELVFWTSEGAIAGFRVLWEDAEVARCDANTENCSFNIPPQ